MTMQPIYRSGFMAGAFDPTEVLNALLIEVPWQARTDARYECFMSKVPRSYTYGTGKGVRTYHSMEMTPYVSAIMSRLNEATNLDFNGVFLNRYDTQKQQLGWHADDSPEHDMNHPIAVVSVGQARELWWRKKGSRGATPLDQRQLLTPGSLFIMPTGFQLGHEHKIPRGDREMKVRVSLTFRRFLVETLR
jgi:alkylated DNA repair dioxygenase AlkB